MLPGGSEGRPGGQRKRGKADERSPAAAQRKGKKGVGEDSHCM